MKTHDSLSAVREFIDEYCEVGEYEESGQRLYFAYRLYAKDHGVSNREKLSDKKFASEMKNIGFKHTPRQWFTPSSAYSGGALYVSDKRRQVTWWEGIKVHPSMIKEVIDYAALFEHKEI